MPMGKTTINKAVPRKLKTSFLSVKKKKEFIPSSKYQIARATRQEIRNKIRGKIRQQFFEVLIKSIFDFKINEKRRINVYVP